MKTFPALLAAAALSAGATAGVLELLRPLPESPASSKTSSETSARTAASPAEAKARDEARPDADLVSAVDPMEAERIAQLEARVADLERQLDRRPVAVPESETAAELAALDVDDPEARQLVLDVMAAEEARQRAERDARREQERLDELNRRADRLAEQVGLNGQQKSELVEVWLAEEERRNAARDLIRDAGTGWDGARDAFREIETWKEAELVQRFGAVTAEAIGENDRSGRRGGRGGRGF